MAKLSKTVLKGIVKECLVEILSEGLAGNQASLSEASLRKPNPPRRKEKSRKEPGNRLPVDTVSFTNAVDKTVKKVTNDPVMAMLLSDTASTTLQEQYSAGESSLAGNAATAGIPLDESAGLDIFGDAAQNWADLAFSDPKP